MNPFLFSTKARSTRNNASPFLMRFLCGDDERLYEEFMEGPSGGGGEAFYTNPNDPGIGPLRGTVRRYQYPPSRCSGSGDHSKSRLAHLTSLDSFPTAGNLASRRESDQASVEKGPNLRIFSRFFSDSGKRKFGRLKKLVVLLLNSDPMAENPDSPSDFPLGELREITLLIPGEHFFCETLSVRRSCSARFY